ncbi:taste receptor, type 2, member 201, tandem duplicate 1 [Brachionichthys hirsutus]|uniref:taste receptor, type 2, member 201, tandem duplicate 1 n=1 Tax=Brachionichthys hirsutus TaxID=412623 RepID=UPI0036051D00
MDFITFGFVNGPFVILNILINIFFIFCMVRPLHGQQIKQPLKLLLGTLICCTMIYLLSAMLHYIFMITGYSKFMTVSFSLFVYTLYTSMSSSVWLNFFFFTQIVPAQRASFTWIKKNIKTVIYCIWLLDKCLSLCNVNLIIGMCVMVMSSSSTVLYLCKHMHRMVAIGQPFSCSRFRSQVRVTITGILQGIMYMICAVWTVEKYFSGDVNSGYSLIQVTVINFYMMGTTFNLGAGQSAFRQRAANIWLSATQLLKGPDVQPAEEAG